MPIDSSANSPNLQLVRKFYDSIVAGKRTEPRTLMYTDVAYKIPEGFPAAGGTYKGLKAVLEQFLDLWYGALDLKIEPREMLDAGDRVTVLGRLVGKAQATGARVDFPFCHVWTCAAGKLTRYQVFTDTAMLAKAAWGKPTGGS